MVSTDQGAGLKATSDNVAGLVVLDRWSRLYHPFIRRFTKVLSLALLYWIDGLDWSFKAMKLATFSCRWPCCIG